MITESELKLLMNFDFEKELSINKYKLDEECLSQSSLFAYYSDLQQGLKTQLNLAKDELEKVYAETNLRVRSDLIEKGVKFTESVVSATVELEEPIIEAKQKIRNIESYYNSATVIVNAFNMRCSELDNLTKLYCAGYFSATQMEAKKDINEQTSIDIKKKINNK